MEVGLPIKDFEEFYSILSDGTVISKRKNKELKPIMCGDYLAVCLCGNGKKKREYVHRLVAQHFLENKENKKTVNHKDGNKLNNHLTNLEWNTQSENNIHAFENGLRKPKVKFPKELVEKARKLYNETNLSCSKISDIFGVSKMQMWRILKEKGRTKL